jgi:MYXO-CTERM domain-containing protein
VISLAAAVALLASARAARADGAFPDSLGIIAPADRPHDIVVPTTFGVVSSIDDGQTWTWSCEQDKNAFGSQYQMGAPPLDRIYTRSQGKLAFSDDRTCGWSVNGGAVGTAVITDAFPDPTNPNRVLVIAQAADADGGIGYSVYESSDAGSTFSTVRYTAASGDIVTGVEVARAAPATMYLTLRSGSAGVPKLGKSTDGGATWQVRDLTAALGAGVRSFSLIAVDPVNAARIYLRVADAAGERLAITDDGGATATTPLMLPAGVMTAFVRTPSGAMLLAGKIGLGPVLYRSTDGAATFQTLPVPPTLLGMAARGTSIYGATDTQVEDSGAFVSADQGQSWQSLLRFDAIQAIDSCVKVKCQDDCQMRAALGQWSADMCDAVPAPHGTGAGDAGVDGAKALADAGADHPAADAGTAPPPASGCHCAAGGAAPGSPAAAALPAAVLLVALHRRRRGRSRAVRRARAAARHADLALDDVGDGLDQVLGLDRLG